MDTADTIKEMVQGGLQPELVFALCQFILVGFLLVYLRNAVINEVAYRSFKGSSCLGNGSWLRMKTTTGHIDGIVTGYSRRWIHIKTADGTVHEPMKRYPEKSWYVLDSKPS